MVRKSLKDALLKLYQYFRLNNLPNAEQIDLWYDDLKFIPDDMVDDIIKEIKDCDSIPRNIVKAFRRAYFINKRGRQSGIEYDKYDDPSFPVSLLWRAFSILEVNGYDDFMRYCRSVKMPEQDIERVENKQKRYA